MASKHPFPYATVDTMLQDKGAKLGVAASDFKDEMYSLLKIGWYQKQERKQMNAKRVEREERVEAILAAAERDPQLRAKFADLLESKADKQLGRKSA